MLIPNCPICADNFFCGAHFKDRARQIALLKDRPLYFISASIRFSFYAYELQPLFVQQNTSFHGLIGDFNIHHIGVARLVSILTDEYRKIVLPNQIAPGCLNFLNKIRAPRYRFGQQHRTAIVRGECVDLLRRRIIQLLRNICPLCVLELERRTCQRNGLACVAVQLDEPQTIPDRLVAQHQLRRVHKVFLTVDFKGNWPFQLIPRLALRLLQNIDAIGQRLCFRIAPLISFQVVALTFAGVLVRAS